MREGVRDVDHFGEDITMEKIKIAITGRVASIAALPEVVADNAEYEVDFALDPREGWDMSLPITALFVRLDGSYTARILDAGATSCTMPPQTGTNIVYVGMTQDDMRTTTPATIKVRRSIRTVANDPLPAPTEDVYAQILAAYAGIKILSGKGAPTSTTQGKVNQLYRDELTDKLYICTGVEGGYTWAAVVSDTEDAVTYTAQTLTEEQKTQARANIGAGTSNFSGSYNDLNDQPNIPAATVIDTTLTKSGQAADAKAAGDAIGKKLDKAQGVENAGMILGVDESGNVVPEDKPVQALAGATAPTTATAGVVGQEYYVIVNNAVTEMYVCTAALIGSYTWYKVEFGGGGGSLSNAAKTALLNCFAHVAWTDENGQSYYNALQSALNSSSGGDSQQVTITQTGTQLVIANVAAITSISQSGTTLTLS